MNDQLPPKPPIARHPSVICAARDLDCGCRSTSTPHFC